MKVEKAVDWSNNSHIQKHHALLDPPEEASRGGTAEGIACESQAGIMACRALRCSSSLESETGVGANLPLQ